MPVDIEIYWHPRLDKRGRPYALAVHVTYSLGDGFHTSESTTVFGAGGLDASALSIFDIITLACEEAETARVLMLASTQGRLMAANARVH